MAVLVLIDYGTDNDLDVCCDDGDRVGVMHNPSNHQPKPQVRMMMTALEKLK